VDTTKDTLVVHDGVTPGGKPVLSASAGAVGTTNLADSGVTTAKIADSNVTTAKIADANVTTAKIADANITTAKIADANVTRAKASNGVVGGWRGTLGIGSNTTLTNADAGKYINISAASLAVQINTSTLTVGDRFHFNGNGGSCTLTRTDGGNFISYGNTTVASVVVSDGNGISLFWDGGALIIENSSLNIQRQSWADVTGSRAFTVTYTNTSGKPRTVHVAAYSGATNGNKQLNGYVNGVPVALNGFYSTTGNNYPSVSFVVPAGATYGADTFGSNVSISLTKWMELS